MNPILRNILAVVAGIVVGSLVNMALINISGSVIPPPEGSDLSNIDGLTAAMGKFEPKHFLMPFLAHALGTFAGAFVAAKFGRHHRIWLAIVVGIYFLIGGIAMVFVLPSPMWFNVLDLTLAYIPMSLLAAKIAVKIKPSI